MASILPRRDADGTIIGWQTVIRKKGYPTQTKTFRSKREAEDWAKVIESEMVRGSWRDRSTEKSLLLAAALQRYITEVLPRKASAQRELSFVRQWLKRSISQHYLGNIRGTDIVQCIKEMEAEGKSANTIRLHLALISHLFSVAKTEWGMEWLENPVALAKGRRPRLPRGRERRIRPGEVGALIGHASWPLAVLIAVALETAMRKEELVGLTWENINLTGRSIFLSKTKNGLPRSVPISPTAIEALQILGPKESGSVFGFSLYGLDSAWDRLRDQVGISHGWDNDSLHLHDLRHEATSRFFERTDLDIMEIRAITGHKTLQMLARYTHLRTALLADRLAGGKRGSAVTYR